MEPSFEMYISGYIAVIHLNKFITLHSGEMNSYEQPNFSLSANKIMSEMLQ